MGLACISVDLDSLPLYCRIYGLPESLLDGKARRLVYATALERFLELFSDLSVPATLFVIGEDLANPEPVAALRRARAMGIEIANHTYAHDYALTQKPDLVIESEVERGEQAIEAAVGERPVGFRAPGYAISAALYQTLCRRGYWYDSSVFPAAPYYLTKAAVIASLAVLGRASRAILDSPKVLLAPRLPYFPDPSQPYRRGDGAVLELPIATHPLTRIPFIGAMATGFPRAMVKAIYRGLRRSAFFNFQLHGIDLLDAGDGIPAELVRAQKDLSIPCQQKRARLKEIFGWMKVDHQLITLAEVPKRSRERTAHTDV